MHSILSNIFIYFVSFLLIFRHRRACACRRRSSDQHTAVLVCLQYTLLLDIAFDLYRDHRHRLLSTIAANNCCTNKNT